jgi:hypothetical protein
MTAQRLAGPLTILFVEGDFDQPLAAMDYCSRTITFNADKLKQFNAQMQGNIMAHELMHFWTWAQGKLG